MKYLLIGLLFIGKIGYGQLFGTRIPYQTDTPLLRKDTVKCIMFVTDSSQLNVKLNVYGIFGYIVKEQSWKCCDPQNNSFAAYYWETYGIFYLDDKKKPLSKNIIVWQSKEINKQ